MTSGALRRSELFVAGGQGFVFETDQIGLMSMIADRLRDLRAPEAFMANEPTVFRIERNGPPWMSHPWGVWRDGEPCETTVHNDYIMPYVIWEVTRLAIENVAPHVSAHAAAVELGGRGLMIVGASHSGKSTLSGSLVRQGWGFLTDELVTLEHDRDTASTTLHPFWRPIGVRRGGPLDEVIDLPGQEAEVVVPASVLGRLSGPVPLTAVVFAAYAPGEATEPARLTAGEALEKFATQAPELGGDRIGEVFAAMADIVSGVPCFAIGVDDLTAAEAALSRLVTAAGADRDVPSSVATGASG